MDLTTRTNLRTGDTGRVLLDALRCGVTLSTGRETVSVHAIDYSGAQDGIAFRVENAILTLAWLGAGPQAAQDASVASYEENLLIQGALA